MSRLEPLVGRGSHIVFLFTLNLTDRVRVKTMLDTGNKSGKMCCLLSATIAIIPPEYTCCTDSVVLYFSFAIHHINSLFTWKYRQPSFESISLTRGLSAK